MMLNTKLHIRAQGYTTAVRFMDDTNQSITIHQVIHSF